MGRSSFRRHYRLLSAGGGLAFAALVWVVNGSHTDALSASLALLVGLAFAGGMWAAGRAASRRT